MPTKQQIMKALEGSIEKWRKIVVREGSDNGPEDCPLCDLFHDDDLCAGCPVSEASGSGICHDTPYGSWRKHNFFKHLSMFTSKNECGTCTRLARKELEFLESLKE